MSDQPDQLSQLLLEADGLLLLLHHHRDETPVDAIKLLRRKLELILALTDGLDEWEDNEPVAENSADEDEDKTAVHEMTENSEEESQIVENGSSNASETESDEALTEEVSTETLITPETSSTIISVEDQSFHNDRQEEVGDYVEETVENAFSQEVSDAPTVIEEQSMEEPSFYQPATNPGVLNDEVVFMNDTPKDSSEATTREYIPETPEIIKNEIPQETLKETQREIERRFIDDAPIYKPRLHNDDDSSWISTTSDITASRRPVSSVFNLNDKFRFRRELFGNSDAQYVECLDLLSAMTSIDEAKEYLYDDLQWDSENEDVKAFIDLLSNYYRH